MTDREDGSVEGVPPRRVSGRVRPTNGDRRAKAWIAIVLTAIAGFVDVLGYLSLGHTLVAHLSGDTAAGMLHATRGELRPALHRLLPIPGFLVGLFVGRMLAAYAASKRTRRRLSVVLGLEMLLLSGFMFAHRAAPAVAVVVVAGAMGVQNAAVRHVGGHEVRTTFVTGMLVSLVEELVDSWIGGDPDRRPYVLLHAAVWCAFALGVCAGAVAWAHLGASAMLLAVGAVAVVVARDVVTPAFPRA